MSYQSNCFTRVLPGYFIFYFFKFFREISVAHTSYIYMYVQLQHSLRGNKAAEALLPVQFCYSCLEYIVAQAMEDQTRDIFMSSFDCLFEICFKFWI